MGYSRIPINELLNQIGSAYILNTVCPRSSDSFYIASYYIKWVTTSWTYSKWFLVHMYGFYCWLYTLHLQGFYLRLKIGNFIGCYTAHFLVIRAKVYHYTGMISIMLYPLYEIYYTFKVLIHLKIIQWLTHTKLNILCFIPNYWDEMRVDPPNPS